MKNIIIVLSVFLAGFTVASAQTATKKELQKATYACPMHPSEMSMKEGKCSKCGMEMTKRELQKATYTCPMHSGEMSMKEGKCSKCGMKLVKTELKHNSAVKGSQSNGKLVVKYVCSMDGSTSDKPGKCSKCGMEMTKKESVKK